MTRSAQTFLAALDGVTDAARDGATLPLAVQHICTELEQATKQREAGTEGNTLQVRHRMHTAHGAILIRGYGIVEQHGGLTGRFLILFETAPTESSAHEQQVQGETAYRFTARQQTIVNELVLARTNKEIAESMQRHRGTGLRVHAPVTETVRPPNSTGRTGHCSGGVSARCTRPPPGRGVPRR
jgi:hypothetical protein